MRLSQKQYFVKNITYDTFKIIAHRYESVYIDCEYDFSNWNLCYKNMEAYYLSKEKWIQIS